VRGGVFWAARWTKLSAHELGIATNRAPVVLRQDSIDANVRRERKDLRVMDNTGAVNRQILGRVGKGQHDSGGHFRLDDGADEVAVEESNRTSASVAAHVDSDDLASAAAGGDVSRLATESSSTGDAVDERGAIISLNALIPNRNASVNVRVRKNGG